MATADTARLIASLELKDLFSGKVNTINKSLGQLDSSVTRTGGRALKAGHQIGTGIKSGAVIAAGAIGFLATNIGIGLRSLVELESATAQTNAVLKSTKGVAGETAASIRDLAEKYEGLNATIDDKVIQSGENVLLTFTNIRKQAFEPALAAALDLSTAMGTSLQGSIVQVGKALSDPIKGITALTRVGVTFTAQQKDQIKALVKTGDTLGAQRIILKELNKEFGGSFLAGGQTTAGKVAKFKDSIEDLQKALATALLPTIGKVADGLSKFLSDPQVVKGVSQLGESIAGLFSDANLKAGADFLKGAFQTAKEAAPVVTAAAKATFGLVQSAVGLFKSLPPEIQKLAVGAFAVNKLTGGLVTNIAGGIIDTVGKSFLQRGGTPANPLFVSDVTGGIAGAATKGIAGVGLASIATTLLTTVAIPAVVGLFIAGKFAGVGPFQDEHPMVVKTFDHKAGTATTGTQDSPLGKMTTEAVRKLSVTFQASVAEFRKATAALRGAKTGKEVAAAIKASLGLIFTKGLGGSGGAENTLKALRAQLKNTHDPALQRTLQAAIGKVEHKLAARKVVEDQLKKADQIFRSSKTNAQKIKELEHVEKVIGNRNSIATKRVQDKIDQAKRAQVAEQKRTTAEVRRKKLAVTNNITIPVANTVSVDARAVVRTNTTFHKYFSTATTRVQE